MTRIKLTTDDIFTKDKRKMRILTSGIDVTEFISNPVMLFEHNPEKNLGVWGSIEINENDITAIPMFDDDDLSLTIANKVKKGSVKCASVGLEVDDAYLDGDVVTISKSKLFEASIVGIPANPKAKAIEFHNMPVIFCSGKKEIDDSFFENLKNSNKMEEIKEVVPELIVPVQEAKTEILEESKIELAIGDMPMVDIIPAQDQVQPQMISMEEHTKMMEEYTSETTKLKAEIISMQLELDNKDKEIARLNQLVNEFQTEKIENLVEDAIKNGKITKESKVDFVELSFEKAKSILDKMTPKNISLSETLKASKKEVENNDSKSYEWYLKNDKEGLKTLSRQNPALYKQIESAYEKTLIKK